MGLNTYFSFLEAQYQLPPKIKTKHTPTTKKFIKRLLNDLWCYTPTL